MNKLLKRLYKSLRMTFLLSTRYHFASVGRDFYCGKELLIRPDCVSVGDHVFIGNRCHLASVVSIGNFVMLASDVSIVGGDHCYDRVGTPIIFSGRGNNRPVVIEDDVWIGHGAIIMHGITIRVGAIVASGSIVTQDVEAFTIVGGVPARIIKSRFKTVEQEEQHRVALTDYRKSRILPSNWSTAE